MMKRIETYRVTYDIVTPLFCGGAHPVTPELRLPSFKGVLRWYWRAVAWQSLGGDLAAIHHEEAVMFGSPENGQGKVCMRQVIGAAPRVWKAGEVLTGAGGTVGPGARYLGYGVMTAFASRDKGTKEGELTRGCLLPPLSCVVAGWRTRSVRGCCWRCARSGCWGRWGARVARATAAWCCAS